MENYDAYLPHIDAVEGINRIMKNKKMYITMLGRFKLQPMTDTLVEAIASGDTEKITFAAHALKGTAGNLGFATLYTLAGEMESQAKEGVALDGRVGELTELIGVIKPLMEKFIAEEA